MKYSILLYNNILEARKRSKITHEQELAMSYSAITGHTGCSSSSSSSSSVAPANPERLMPTSPSLQSVTGSTFPTAPQGPAGMMPTINFNFYTVAGPK